MPYRLREPNSARANQGRLIRSRPSAWRGMEDRGQFGVLVPRAVWQGIAWPCSMASTCLPAAPALPLRWTEGCVWGLFSSSWSVWALETRRERSGRQGEGRVCKKIDKGLPPLSGPASSPLAQPATHTHPHAMRCGAVRYAAGVCSRRCAIFGGSAHLAGRKPLVGR